MSTDLPPEASSAKPGAAPPVPGAPKPQRPATLVFTQAVLALQALAALFATLVTWGLSRGDNVSVSTGWIWGAGALLMIALVYVAGKQKARWGRIAGWVLQAPMILAGLVVPEIAVIAVMFLGLWFMGLRLGGRIDRERAERIEQHSTATVDDAATDSDGDVAGDGS